MLQNYITSAIRNILRHKFHSTVNILGLSIGIAFCTLIVLYIRDERSFDKFHVNKDNLYRIEARNFSYRDFKNGSTNPFEETAITRTGVGEVMRDELPEVVRMTRVDGNFTAILRNDDKVFTENVKGVDSSFFRMFSFRLLAGNSKTIFKSRHEVILTPQIAEKYFGDESPLGKVMSLEFLGRPSVMVTVAGIIEAAPPNSSILYDVLIALEDSPGFKEGFDDGSNCKTFVQLRPGTDLPLFNANLNRLMNKYTGEKSKAFREREKIPAEFVDKLYARRFTDVHLNTRIPSERSSDPQYSMVLGGVALLITIIACINYISISLTNAATRGTEVGIRKVSGAIKSQLTFQFGLEAMVLCLVSMVLAMILVTLFLPLFNSFTGKGISLSLWDWLELGLFALIITFLIGSIAGSYPALFLSSLKPVMILKGRFNTKAKMWLMKPLIVVQFAFSAFLIMTSLVMHRQMRFLTTMDLGYNQHQVLIIKTQQLQDETTDKFVDNFRAALAPYPSVKSVAGSGVAFTQGMFMMGFQQAGEFKTANGYIVDPEYISTLEIRLLQGRNFDDRSPADLKDAVIVNEALVKKMGWVNPLQEHLSWRSGMGGVDSNVIGVVKDHNFASLESEVGPMFMTMDKTFGHYQFMIVRISPNDIPGTMSLLSKTYNNLAPDKPFEYTFLDENVALQYASYERWMNIMTLSTVFAILISCLGLFGLAGTNVANRTKEIGIRKSLGAELSHIFILLNRQYFLFSVVAFVLAAFPAWYFMNKWLNNFHFKIDVSWWLYLNGMGISLFVALVTLSYHSLRAIRINPIECLRHE